MSEKAVLTLNGNTPDTAEVMDFLTIMFGSEWPGDVEDKVSKFVNLVYAVTRRAGFTIYQDTEISSYLGQDRNYAAVFDKTYDKWFIIVARGDEYNGAIEALRFIVDRQGGEPTG